VGQIVVREADQSAVLWRVGGKTVGQQEKALRLVQLVAHLISYNKKMTRALCDFVKEKCHEKIN
jgi:hypothetical protein